MQRIEITGLFLFFRESRCLGSFSQFSIFKWAWECELLLQHAMRRKLTNYRVEIHGKIP
jgi:hypothetical protein